MKIPVMNENDKRERSESFNFDTFFMLPLDLMDISKSGSGFFLTYIRLLATYYNVYLFSDH